MVGQTFLLGLEGAVVRKIWTLFKIATLDILCKYYTFTQFFNIIREATNNIPRGGVAQIFGATVNIHHNGGGGGW
jgi:hypothetical protein